MCFTVLVLVYDVMVGIVAYILALYHRCQFAVFGLAYATVYAAVFRHRVGYAEAYHAVVAFAITFAHEFLGKYSEAVATVEVVGIDDCERFVDSSCAHKHCMCRAPGFGTVGRACEAFGKFVDSLEDNFYRYRAFIFRKHFFAEVSFEILADNKYNFTESGAKSIEYRVVHDCLAVGAETVELFEAAVTAAHTGSKNK